MAEPKRYYWLKLQHDLFSSKRIKKLRRMGDKYLVIYLRLQLLTVKTNGVLHYTDMEDSFAEEIALDLDEDVDDVDKTINFLIHNDLIRVKDDHTYILPYVQANIGCETAAAQRMRKHRMSQCNDNALHCYAGVTQALHKCYGEKEKEKEIEIESEKELASSIYLTDGGMGEDEEVKLSTTQRKHSMTRPITFSWGNEDDIMDEGNEG